MVTSTLIGYNIIDGIEVVDEHAKLVDRFGPADGALIGKRVESGAVEIQHALAAARAGHSTWASTTPVYRGEVLRAIARRLENRIEALAELVHLETGKSMAMARGEVRGAIELAYFTAAEGRRFYGRTTTSGIAGKQVSTWRAPVGVGALIAASNTPVPNYAWKVFPALLAGNSVILKPSEHTPFSAVEFVKLCLECGVPASALQLIQGSGPGTGSLLVDSKIDLVSFTGSAAVGRRILGSAGSRLLRAAVELGGKNAMIVCDDANLSAAADAAVASAFSNAGQRCAATSRIIVMAGVYEEFSQLLLERTAALTLTGKDDSIGPVIGDLAVSRITTAVSGAVERGAKVLAGGPDSVPKELATGCYVAPTILSDVDPDDPISLEEVFGPVANLYKVQSFADAIALAAHTEYGLTGAIWTDSVDRAFHFTSTARVGMAVVNGPTFGSEPHMPFGGFGSSGNGTRECGTEVFDFYTELRTVAVLTREPQ